MPNKNWKPFTWPITFGILPNNNFTQVCSHNLNKFGGKLDNWTKYRKPRDVKMYQCAKKVGVKKSYLE